jgi:hypothetical protein
MDARFRLWLAGGKLGLRMSEVADDASREEVNFLREMTALAELHAVRTSRQSRTMTIQVCETDRSYQRLADDPACWVPRVGGLYF